VKERIKTFLKDQRQRIIYASARKNIKNKDFTIISNNCWGGHVYQDLNLEYRSPFVGLYLHLPCYLKLLNNLEHYMDQELTFSDTSKYEKADRKRKENYYPFGKLDDIELHMLHYSSEDEAYSKWNRRKERMNWDNLFYKISADNDEYIDLLEEFDKLKFPNKVCLSPYNLGTVQCNVQIPKFTVRNEMSNYSKYFDFVTWLNEGKVNIR